ncbi:MAG: hypothetical protein ABEJ02_03080 [Candidatus Paceibacteria bacterium]
MSSKRATITITSKEKPIEATTAVEVTSESKPLGAKAMKGMVTSTQIKAQGTFNPTGEKEVAATATGKITIHNESGIDQPLVATTRFLSEDDVLFRLVNDVEVPANSTIEADVYADQKGEQRNIGPSRFTIPGLNPSRREVVYGTSDEPMTGGVKTIGAISESDVKKAREKLRQEIKDRAREQLKSLKDPNKELLVSVQQSQARTKNEIGDQVDNFDMTMEADVVAVIYDQEKVRQLAERALMKKGVNDTEVIKSGDSEPNVKFDSFDKKDRSAVLTVTTKGTSSLNPDSKQLNKVMFFGKTEEEVRRYLLSLEHVHSVDIEFSPAWIDSVPHVSDHVNVVVKKVK